MRKSKCIKYGVIKYDYNKELIKDKVKQKELLIRLLYKHLDEIEYSIDHVGDYAIITAEMMDAKKQVLRIWRKEQKNTREMIRQLK